MNFWSRTAEVLYIFFRTASTLRTTRRSGSPAAKAESKSSKSTRNVKKRDASAVVTRLKRSRLAPSWRRPANSTDRTTVWKHAIKRLSPKAASLECYVFVPSQQNSCLKNNGAMLSIVPDGPASSPAHGVPIAGIGASAGGLDALKALLAALPPDTGMAFVVVQHLDPIHVSLMAGLLSGHTAMPVTQTAEGVSIEPNRAYLIPPGVSLAVAGGKLHLSALTERYGARTAFDVFLRSLAEDCGERAIGVVLSGSGSDGSEGLKESKGGFVIVQEPSEAAFDGMPKSAIQTGQADCILPVAKIPAALIKRMTCFHPADAKYYIRNEARLISQGLMRRSAMQTINISEV